MSQQTFQRQILLGYGVAMALTALVLAWGLINLSRLGQASDAILRENYRSILAAEKIRDAIQRQESATVFLLVEDHRDAVRRVSDSERQFLLNLSRAKDNITIPGEKAILDELNDAYDQYMFHFNRFLQLPRTDTPAGLAYYRENLQPKVTAIQLACDRLLELNHDTMVAGSERAHRVAQTAIWSMLLVGAGAIAVAVWFSFFLSSTISRPIRDLVRATEQVAGEDYDIHLSERSSLEFANLATHFNAMAAKLRGYHQMRIGEMIAEKKKTETILQTIDDGIVVVDAERKIVSMNPAAAAILGGVPIPPGAPDLKDVITQEELVSAIEGSLERAGPGLAAAEPRQLAIARPAGEAHYEYSITPVQAQGGQLVGIVVVLRDITRLWELDRLKSEFVMTASHELRTPLTSMEMSIHLLQERTEGKLEAAEVELLEIAQEEVTRLKRLVTELLDLTKIETGKIEMQFHPVDPRIFLENAVEPFRAQAQQQNVEIVLETSNALPEVQADPNKITWVLTNLIGNSLRYTSPGGHVWVSAARAGQWLHLYVRDDGAGIPHEKQARIFDKFVQLEDAGQPGGAGLGLAISKEIVRAHRGHIWVESEPGQGSLFIVALPLS